METTTAVRKESLEELALRLEELERRVSSLEHPAQTPAAEVPSRDLKLVETGQAGVPPAPSFSLSEGTLANVAIALLAFAGAYLLRAVAESGTIAQPVGVIAGVAYALFWLVWATRRPAADSVASTLYSLTASAVFAGLLWENSVRVHVLPSGWSAIFIVLFTYAGHLLAWRKSLPEIANIVTFVTALLALGLLFATHDVVPFTVALLATGAACEVAACQGKWLGQRWVAGLAADFAVFIAAWVITRPQGLAEGYTPFGMTGVVALQIALVLIYIVSMGYRTLVQDRDICRFETTQNVVAIGLFIWGSMQMSQQAPAVAFVVEAFCLLAGITSYAIAVMFLSRRQILRNFVMYGIFGLALVLAGLLAAFSGLGLVLSTCFIAIAMAWLGSHEHRISLQLHAPVYLVTAAIASGLVGFSVSALHGSSAPAGSRLLEIALTAIALGICYALAGSGGAGRARVPALLIAGLLCWALLGLSAAGISKALGPDSFVSSPLRTGLICALALASAAIGVRSKPPAERPECVWLIYPLMLYGGYRLLVEDFPSGRPTALALSLLFYGGTLLMLTRVVRLRRDPA